MPFKIASTQHYINVMINSTREDKFFDNALSIAGITESRGIQAHSGQCVNNCPDNGMPHLPEQNFPKLEHGPCQIFLKTFFS